LNQRFRKTGNKKEEAPMKNLLIVGAGGMLGAVSRYLIGGWVSDLSAGRFPHGTLVINLTGSFLLGVFLTLALENFDWSPGVRLFFAVGFLGSYTTFSTFSYETAVLLQEGSWWLAALNAASNLLGCLAATLAGIALARSVF